MEDVKRLAKEKLDLTPEEVVDYLQRHRPRVILHSIAFSLQFGTIWWFMRGHSWKERYGLTKLWLLLWVIVLLTIFELIRFGDFVLKKYGYLHHLEGSGHKSNSSPSKSGSTPSKSWGNSGSKSGSLSGSSSPTKSPPSAPKTPPPAKPSSPSSGKPGSKPPSSLSSSPKKKTQ